MINQNSFYFNTCRRKSHYVLGTSQALGTVKVTDFLQKYFADRRVPLECDEDISDVDEDCVTPHRSKSCCSQQAAGSKPCLTQETDEKNRIAEENQLAKEDREALLIEREIIMNLDILEDFEPEASCKTPLEPSSKNEGSKHFKKTKAPTPKISGSTLDKSSKREKKLIKAPRLCKAPSSSTVSSSNAKKQPKSTQKSSAPAKTNDFDLKIISVNMAPTQNYTTKPLPMASKPSPAKGFFNKLANAPKFPPKHQKPKDYGTPRSLCSGLGPKSDLNRISKKVLRVSKKPYPLTKPPSHHNQQRAKNSLKADFTKPVPVQEPKMKTKLPEAKSPFFFKCKSVVVDRRKM